MRRAIAPLLALLFALVAFTRAEAQTDVDTITNVYQLGDLVIHGNAKGLNLEGFMDQVKQDTSFLHAFLNMRYFPHTVKSGLLVRNKGENEMATLYRQGHLLRTGPNAELQIDSTSETGKLRSKNGDMRYLTAELYDDLFWPKGQWKADNSIASEHRNGHLCWLFSAVAKDSLDGKRVSDDATVIKTMHTWFDQSTMQVIARDYRIAHSSWLLDFDISILVDNTVVAGELVPTFVRYDGDWDIPFHKRELVRFWLAMEKWRIDR